MLRSKRGDTQNLVFVISNGAVVSQTDFEEAKKWSKGLFNFHGKKIFKLINQAYKSMKL